MLKKFSKNEYIMFGIFLALLIAIVGVFWPTVLSLHNRWIEVNESYSHGYLVVLLSFALVYTKWRDARIEVQPTLAALPVLLIISILWFFANSTQTQLIEQLILPIIVWLCLATIIGWSGALRFYGAFIFIYTAIPLWDFLTLPLRYATVFVVQQSLGLISIPAFIDGFRIHLPSGILIVAGGCAGLNYFMVGMIIGIINAHSFYRSLSSRVMVFLLAIVVAIFANWVRVFVLVLVGYYSRMQSPLIYNHGSFGWIVFGVFLFLYIYLVRSIFNPEEKPSFVDDKKSSLIEIPIKRILAYGAMSIIVVSVIPTMARLQSSDEWIPDGAIFSSLSPDLFPAVDNDQPIWLADFHGYDEIEKKITEVNERVYELVALNYLRQYQGKELIYYKNTLADELNLEDFAPISLPDGALINRAIVNTAAGKRLVWWFYFIGKYPAAKDSVGKLLQVPANLFGNKRSSLITVSTLCRSSFCERELESISKDEGYQLFLQTFIEDLYVAG